MNVVSLLLLCMSLLVLLAGPVVDRLAPRAGWLRPALDGFALIAVTGLALVHILPSALARGGAWAIGAALVGCLVPLLAERAPQSGGRGAAVLAGVVLAVGLGVHAALDGVALASPGHHHGSHVLGVGVVLHQLPFALGLWWLLRPAYGPAVAVGALAALGAGTVGGFLAGPALLSALSPPLQGVFDALVAGSILHVVAHRDPHLAREPGGASASGVGGLVGLGLLVLLAASEHDHHGAASGPEVMVALSGMVAPSVLAGLVLAGLICSVRQRWIERLPGGWALVVGVVVALPLLGPWLAALWALAAVGALLAGMGPGPASERPQAALDRTLPWLVAGLALAVLAQVALPEAALPAALGLVLIPSLALLGLPLTLPVFAALPLVAVLVHKGLPGAAALAFLVTASLPRGQQGVSLALGVGAGLLAWWWVDPAIAAHPGHPGLLEQVGLLLLLGLMASSLLRQGTRAFVERVVAAPVSSARP